MYATEDHAVTLKFTRKLLRERAAMQAEMNVLILAAPYSALHGTPDEPTLYDVHRTAPLPRPAREIEHFHDGPTALHLIPGERRRWRG